MTLGYICIALIVIIIFGFIWAHVCNDRTLDQRLDILCSQGPDKVEKVTYNKHFIYLLTFRDPLKLYK